MNKTDMLLARINELQTSLSAACDDVIKLQAENEKLKDRLADMLRLSGENVILREELTKELLRAEDNCRVMDIDENISLHVKSIRQALNSTPETAKIHAVLDAASQLGEYFCKLGHEKRIPCPDVGGKALYKAYREWRK
jgi:regulator of replication initiation timing